MLQIAARQSAAGERSAKRKDRNEVPSQISPEA